MNTMNFTKPRFIDKILREEATTIKQMQREVIDDYHLKNRSGELRKSVFGGFNISESGIGTRLSLTYVKYLRFLDMDREWINSRREGLHLYNRIVFGRVYNDTRTRIMYAYKDGLKEEAIEEIRKSMHNLNH